MHLGVGIPNEIYTSLAGYRAGPGVPQLANCFTLSVYETGTVEMPKVITTTGAADMTVQTRLRFSDTDPWRVVRSVKANVWTGALCRERIDLGTPPTCTDPTSSIYYGWDSTYRVKVEAVAPTIDYAKVGEIGTAMTGYLRGEAQRYLDRVSSNLSQPTTLRTGMTSLTGAATLLRAYTRVAFPHALDGDDLMSAMLIGDKSIISESPDGPMVSTTYQVAWIRFQPCLPGQTEGCTQNDKLYQPLWQQPYLTGGLPAPVGVALPGEPVGDALISSAMARLAVLQERIGVYSQEIAAGRHTEGLPVFEEVSSRLSLAQSLIQLGPVS